MSYRILLVTVLAVSTAEAAIYVDAANCPGPGNGTLADPYCSLQTAINSIEGGVILVAPGTYERINFNKSNNAVHSTQTSNQRREYCCSVPFMDLE